jgi:Zn-dependent protease
MNELTTVQTLLIVIPVILIAITLHEMMHAVVSLWLGDDTAREDGRINLNPLSHIDPFTTVLLPVILVLAHLPAFGVAKPVMVNMNRVKWGEFGGALIAVAGPLTNLALAILSALLYKAIPALQDGLVEWFMLYMVTINIGFFVFNLIPFPPLDGSRVLYAFAPKSLQNLMDTIESFGLIGFFAFIFLLYPKVLSPLIEFCYSHLLTWLGII